MWAYVFLKANITVENPDSSFIWKVGLFEWGDYKDYRFSPCMLGDEIAKPTRIRAWGIKLPSLGPVCAWLPSENSFRCGRTKTNPHVLLPTNKPGAKRMST